MENYKCKFCKKIFDFRYKKVFCSNECRSSFMKTQHGSQTSNWKSGNIIKICKNCGRKFEVEHNKIEAKYCSRKCTGRKKSGINHPNWTGGKHKNIEGYILCYAPDHPHCVNERYVFEHRLIMEKHLGRYLKPKERIHHLNGIKDDNRIKNLKLFSNDSKHKYYEWSNKQYRQKRFSRPDIRKKDIIPYINKKMSYVKIAKIFKVSRKIISHRMHC